MLMSERIRINDARRRVTDALKGGIRRLGKIHRVAAGAELAPELLAKKHLDITFVVDDENKETHVLSPALRTALEISLIASAALRHITLFSFHGSKRILFYTQTVMQECETLHMARVINCGQRTKFKRESLS
jgi:hypothetical protein